MRRRQNNNPQVRPAKRGGAIKASTKHNLVENYAAHTHGSADTAQFSSSIKVMNFHSTLMNSETANELGLGGSYKKPEPVQMVLYSNAQTNVLKPPSERK